MSYRSRKASELSSQERMMVKRIIHASLLEQQRGAYQFPINDAVNRAAFYTGLTPQVLLKIRDEMSEDKKQNEINKPGSITRYGLNERIIIMDAIDKVFTDEFYSRNPSCTDLIRVVQKVLPSLATDKTENLQISRFIKQRYETREENKSSRNRKDLYEKHQVALERYKYLREIREYRQQNRNIIYLDETWINKKFNCSKIYENLYDLQKLEDLQEDDILIAFSAASKLGFIPGAHKMLPTTTIEADTINQEHFQLWLSRELIQSLPKSSVVVIDDELYYVCSLWRQPRKTSTKVSMCHWLKRNESELHYNKDMTSEELFDLVQKQVKINSKKRYKDVLEKAGHTLLKLPSFMSKLNPYTMMWDKLKSDLATSDSEAANIDHVKQIITDKISMITPNDWKSSEEQVCEYEEYLWTKDHRLIDNIEELEQSYSKEKNNKTDT